jgi:RNase P subunit RPR2
MTITQLKNLPQYRDKSDEELIEIRDKILSGTMEGRIEKIIESFKDDYDLSDMTGNDRLALNELARTFILLEDTWQALNDAREEGDWSLYGAINREAHRLRDDISTLQKDLSIARRSRQESGQRSVVDFIEDIKTRAKSFIDSRLKEIYCPECKMLLAKAWFLYPDESNELALLCGRCGKAFKLESSDLESGKNLSAGPPF